MSKKLVDQQRDQSAKVNARLSSTAVAFETCPISPIGGCDKVIGWPVYQETRDTIAVLEAPEAGIHPSAIEALADATVGTPTLQLLVTTYSPIWLATVPPDRLRRFVRDAGAIRVLPGIDTLTADDEGAVEVPSKVTRELQFSAGLL